MPHRLAHFNLCLFWLLSSLVLFCYIGNIELAKGVFFSLFSITIPPFCRLTRGKWYNGNKDTKILIHNRATLNKEKRV